MLSFSLGAGPVPALLLPEIFASRIRAKAVALSLGMHWVCLLEQELKFIPIFLFIEHSSMNCRFTSKLLNYYGQYLITHAPSSSLQEQEVLWMLIQSQLPTGLNFILLNDDLGCIN